MHQNPYHVAVGNQRHNEMFGRPSLPVSQASTNLNYKSPLSLTETIYSFIRPQKELSSEIPSSSAENMITQTNPLQEQLTKEPLSQQETSTGDDNRQVFTSASSNTSKDSLQIQNIMVLDHSNDGVSSQVKNIETTSMTNVKQDLKTWILSRHQRDRMKEVLSSSLCFSSNQEKHSDSLLGPKKLTKNTIRTMLTQNNTNHSRESPNSVQKYSKSTDIPQNKLTQKPSKQPMVRTFQMDQSLTIINQNHQKVRLSKFTFKICIKMYQRKRIHKF